MRATFHLAKRFLQRVLNKESYTSKELNDIYFYLNEIVKTIIPRSYRGYCTFPDNPNFVIAYQENIATTILPKEYIKEDILYLEGKLSKKEFRKILAKRG